MVRQCSLQLLVVALARTFLGEASEPCTTAESCDFQLDADDGLGSVELVQAGLGWKSAREAPSASVEGARGFRATEDPPPAALERARSSVREAELELKEKIRTLRHAKQELRALETKEGRLAAIQREIEFELNPQGKFDHVHNKAVLVLIELCGLGICGVDRCFMGQTALGVVKGLTLGGLFVWAIVDCFGILLASLTFTSSIDLLGYRSSFDQSTVTPAFMLAMILLLFHLLAVVSVARSWLGAQSKRRDSACPTPVGNRGDADAAPAAEKQAPREGREAAAPAEAAGAVLQDAREPGFALAEGDVVIATYMKCGTTWMQYIVLTLLYRGDASRIKSLDFQSPFIDEIFQEGAGKGEKGKGKDKEKDKEKGKGKDKDKDKDKEKDKEGKGKDKDKDKDKKGKDKEKGKNKGAQGFGPPWLCRGEFRPPADGEQPPGDNPFAGLKAWDGSDFCLQRPSPLVVKTHWAPHEVRWDDGMAAIGKAAKVIVVTRNPKDAVVSMFKQSEQFNLPAAKDGFAAFVRRFLAGGFPMTKPRDFWSFYHEWRGVAASNTSALWVCFEDLKRDAHAEIRRVADFLCIEADSDLIDQTARACSFEAMRASGGEQLQKLLNAGKSGGWRDHIQGELNEEFDKVHLGRVTDLQMRFDFDFGADR